MSIMKKLNLLVSANIDEVSTIINIYVLIGINYIELIQYSFLSVSNIKCQLSNYHVSSA